MSHTHETAMSLQFENLVREHYQNLYRFALSLSRHPSDAGDLTQQTFALWAEKGHQLRTASKAKSWLFTTLYREFLRSKRRYTRFPHVELSEAEPELPSVDAAHVRTMEASDALSALACLDDHYREPLSLFYLGDHSYKEIADILTVPIGTVMSRLARGKKMLRQALAQGGGNFAQDPIPFSASGGTHE